MRIFSLLLAALLAPAASAPVRAAGGKADDVKLVEYFVKTPIRELPPDRVDAFMAVDPAELPAKLREPFKARKLELQTLKQLTEGKKKGTIRTPDKNCEVPDEAKSQDPRALLMAGYTEITETEERCVQDKTQCTERDMLCEFSLQIVVLHNRAGKVIGRRLFLYPTDPLMGLVGACRAHNGAGGNTNFFGQMYMTCSH